MQLTKLHSTLQHSAFTTDDVNSRSYECVISGESPFRSWVANDRVLCVFECSKIERGYGHDTARRLESDGSSMRFTVMWRVMKSESCERVGRLASH